MGSFCGANSQSTTNSSNFTNPITGQQQNAIYGEGQRIYAQNAGNPQATVAGINQGQQSLIDYLRGIPGGAAQWGADAAGMTQAGQGYVQNAAGQLGDTSAYLREGADAASAARAPTSLQAWDPNAYMSPYTDSVVNSTLANFDRNTAVDNNSVLGKFILQGGNPFGGDRAGVAFAEKNRTDALARGQLEAGLRQSGFNQASSQAANQQKMDLERQQNDASRQLQAASAYGSLGGTNTGAGSALGNLGSIQSAIGQGYGNIASQSATTQANTATQALEAATLAQKTEQAELNAPWTQLGFLTANSPGTNAAPTTMTNTYPGANPFGTILGGITAASQIPGIGNLFNTGSGTSGQDTNAGYSNQYGFVNAADNDPGTLSWNARGGRIEKAHGGSIADLYRSPEEIYKESLPTSALSGMGGFASPPTQAASAAAAPQATQSSSGSSSGSSFGIGDAIKIGATVLPFLLSDERAKENAEEIGRTHDGQPIYRYNYKGDPRTTIGLMAQDVEKHTPEAVSNIGGLKGVDYNVATKDAVRADGGRMGDGDDVFSRYHRVTGDMRRAQGGEIPRFEDGGRNPPDYYSKPDPNWQPGRSDDSFLGGALRNNATLQSALGIMAGAGKRDHLGLPISPMAQIGQGLQYGVTQAQERDKQEQARYIQERQMWEEKARLAQSLAHQAAIAQGTINGNKTTQQFLAEETARHNRALEDQSRFVTLPDKSRGLYDSKTGKIIGAPTEDRAQQQFNENYAKEHAPKNHDAAASEYAAAAESAENIRAMQKLAPYAQTGYSGPIPPEAMLTARKMAASVGLTNADAIAPTELFKFLAQKGVFNLTSQLKPASDLDMRASERATASMQTDPTTLPLALPVLLRVEERKMAYREAMMDFYRKGVAPSKEDIVGVIAKMNKELPLLNMDGVPGQFNGAPGGPRVEKSATGRLPQPGQPQSEVPLQAPGWTPEDLAAARPGQKTPNGKMIMGRDGMLHPVTGPAGSESNPHEIGLFSGPTLKDGEYAIWNGKLYQQRGTGFGSLVPVERQ